MPGMAADLALAHELADSADELTLARFQSAELLVEAKADGTPVTDTDRDVERAVRRSIATARPGDAVLGEEYGEHGGGRRQWVVDPVDGTKNFVRGVPVWATLLALQVDGEVAVGVVSAPALGRRWWAARGEGAWAGRSTTDARRCRVSRVATLADASLSYSGIGGWAEVGRLAAFLGLAETVVRTRAYGDFWSHVLVAEGAVDVSCEPAVSLWDLAALQVVVEEAGGRFTDLSGTRRTDGGSVVCTNGRLHEEVLTRLTAPAAAATSRR